MIVVVKSLIFTVPVNWVRTLPYESSAVTEIENGSPAAWLRAPGTGLSTLVIHGASENNLTAYPCLESSCPALNEPGIKLILGHRDMHFRKLKNIRVGNSIELELPDKKIQKYQVMEIEILTPEQVVERVNEKKQEDWLVLVTCYPFKYVGPAPKRFVVWARGALFVKTAPLDPPQKLFISQ